MRSRHERGFPAAFAAGLLLAASAPAVGGCAAHRRVGIVEVAGDRVGLVEEGGRARRLLLRSDARALRRLGGCTVEVGGPALLGPVLVRRWRVLDAGDGSVPYVGTLERYGARWLLHDRDSGMAIELDPPPGLAEHAGGLVLVVGYVVGPQRVRVVSWRSLEEGEPAPAEAAGGR